jgi:hypothetical protein
MKLSNTKIAICIPYYRSVEGPTAIALMNLAFHSAASIEGAMIIESSGCYVEDNRNGAVQYALNTGVDFDWLFFVDSDMLMPANAMLRLMSHDKDIVGVNYRTRTPPYGFAAHYLDGTDSHIMEPGLHEMSHVPTGLLLTKFDVYRRLEYPWFKPGMHNEIRDDVYFCAKAREAGYRIWCDHDLTFETVHIGNQLIPWFTKDQVKTVVGAELSIERSRQEAEERANESRSQYEAEKKAAAD